MDQITIDAIDYDIDLGTGKAQVKNNNAGTGLPVVRKLHKIEIEPENKRLQATWYEYDETPTGSLINRRIKTFTSPEEDYNGFEGSALGVSIKKSSINGLFKFILEVSDKIYDDEGAIFNPLPYIEPEDEV